MDVLCIIQNKYTDFSDKEKAIANFLIKEKDNINNISISNLAEKIGTSSASITRFTKKIGFYSFVDLKISLGNTKNNDDLIDEDSIFTDLYRHYKEAIERNFSMLDTNAINSAIKQIKSANRIYIYGVGSSGISSIEFQLRLTRMGLNVNSVTDSHMMVINSSIVNEGDVVIAISKSGETKEVAIALEIAKENKAKIISITNYRNSSIGKIADIILLLYNTEFVDLGNFMNSQFLIMYLLDLISSMLLQDDVLREKMSKTLKAIRKNNR